MMEKYVPRPATILDEPLTWRQVAAIAGGARLQLSAATNMRIMGSRALVESVVEQGIRTYGLNTGVGALCNVIVSPAEQRNLSRNIVMSHSVGVGRLLGPEETRAIIAAAINNFAHGFSGVRLELVQTLLAMLETHCLPEVPVSGSVGYLSHMAHIALVCLGEGYARDLGADAAAAPRQTGLQALALMGVAPLTLEAKEGLSVVNGSPCSTGLAALALARLERMLDWADIVAAMSFENLGGQAASFDANALSLRASRGVAQVGERLRAILAGSGLVAQAHGIRTQDALSLRAVPQVHGAVRDVLAAAGLTLDEELASATDNPSVSGSPASPVVHAHANAIAAAIAFSMDSVCTASAALGSMAERRLDRLVNPLVSGLPAFLATQSGMCSGFMIAQYTASSLVAANRRLSLPASLDGGVTSGLQEDYLCHATPAALKTLEVLDNVQTILAIELLAAMQAYDLQSGATSLAPLTAQVRSRVRDSIAPYRDDRPLHEDIAAARVLLCDAPPAIESNPLAQPAVVNG